MQTKSHNNSCQQILLSILFPVTFLQQASNIYLMGILHVAGECVHSETISHNQLNYLPSGHYQLGWPCPTHYYHHMANIVSNSCDGIMRKANLAINISMIAALCQCQDKNSGERGKTHQTDFNGRTVEKKAREIQL